MGINYPHSGKKLYICDTLLRFKFTVRQATAVRNTDKILHF